MLVVVGIPGTTHERIAASHGSVRPPRRAPQFLCRCVGWLALSCAVPGCVLRNWAGGHTFLAGRFAPVRRWRFGRESGLAVQSGAPDRALHQRCMPGGPCQLLRGLSDWSKGLSVRAFETVE